MGDEKTQRGAFPPIMVTLFQTFLRSVVVEVPCGRCTFFSRAFGKVWNKVTIIGGKDPRWVFSSPCERHLNPLTAFLVFQISHNSRRDVLVRTAVLILWFSDWAKRQKTLLLNVPLQDVGPP